MYVYHYFINIISYIKICFTNVHIVNVFCRVIKRIKINKYVSKRFDEKQERSNIIE